MKAIKSMVVDTAKKAFGEELALPVLFGAVVGVDMGVSAVLAVGGKAIHKAKKALKDPLSSNHVLLNMVQYSKWTAIQIIAKETAKGPPKFAFKHNEYLKQIHKIAKSQAKQDIGKHLDPRDENKAKPLGFVADYLAHLKGQAPESFTETDTQLVASLDGFLAREAQAPTPAQELYEAAAAACEEQVLADLFAIAGTFNANEPNFGVPEFIKKFNDPKTGWAATFRVLLKGRLDDPKNAGEAKRILVAFGAETLQTTIKTAHMIEGLQTRITSIQESLDAQDTVLAEILAVLTPQLPLDLTGTGTRSRNEQFSKLIFTEQRTGFIGRDDEFAQLQAFMEDERPVLWWQIAGDAGQGKSRMALELIQKYAEDWHAGFLPSADFPASDKWNTLAFARPTLCVIDYVASPEKATAAAQAVLALARRTNLTQNIRLLFVEREPFSFAETTKTEALWFQIFRDRRQWDKLKDTVYSQAGPVLLEALDNDAMLAIANSWLEQHQKPTLTPEQTTRFLALLVGKSTDEGIQDRARRPLFAMIFADLVTGSDTTEVKHLSTAIKETLIDEMHQYWKDDTGARIINLADLDAGAVRLACLATMVERVELSDGVLTRDNGDFYTATTPETTRQAWMILGRYLANPGGDNDPNATPMPLSGREPDLIGEYMVYWLLHQQIGRDDPQGHIQALAQDAWSIDAEAYLRFLIRLSEDMTDLSIQTLQQILVKQPPPADALTKLDLPQVLSAASFFGWSEILNAIAKTDLSDHSIDREYNLLLAAQNGHTEVVNALLGMPGIKVNQENTTNGTFPLLMAAQNGHLSIVEVLLAKGADISQRHEEAGTALEFAIGLEQAEMAALLRRHGA